jgi:two-component system, NtrC family, sensor kinase
VQRWQEAVRQRAEEAVRAALIRQQKLVSIGLLSAGVAHEINNPLAFVANNLAVLEHDLKGLMELLGLYKGASEALARAAPEVAARAIALGEELDLEHARANLPRLLSRARDGVDRVTRIVHNLRGLARTDTPRKQDAHLPDLVEATLEIIRVRLRRGGIEIEVDHDANPRLGCVSDQLSQVLLSLLGNALAALEAHPPQGEPPRIRVRTRRQGDDMMIEIADNGPGLDPEARAQIFDPLITAREADGGPGPGLSLSHNIVAAHGGRMEVDSLTGRGTCFRVFLPLTDAPEPEALG